MKFLCRIGWHRGKQTLLGYWDSYARMQRVYRRSCDKCGKIYDTDNRPSNEELVGARNIYGSEDFTPIKKAFNEARRAQ